LAVLTGGLALAPLMAAAQMGQRPGMSGMGNNQQTATTSAPGQQPGAMPGQMGTMQSMMEQGLLHDVAQNSQIETAMSQMALKNSSNPEVRKLAQQVLLDHQKLASDLSASAASRNLSLPSGITRDARKELKKMETLKGSAFDQAYLQQIKHYEGEMQGRLGKGLNMADSPDLRELSSEVQNMAQTHLKQTSGVAQAENLLLQ
jgi:predicted outer membrane protein